MTNISKALTWISNKLKTTVIDKYISRKSLFNKDLCEALISTNNPLNKLEIQDLNFFWKNTQKMKCHANSHCEKGM